MNIWELKENLDNMSKEELATETKKTAIGAAKECRAGGHDLAADLIEVVGDRMLTETTPSGRLIGSVVGLIAATQAKGLPPDHPAWAVIQKCGRDLSVALMMSILMGDDS